MMKEKLIKTQSKKKTNITTVELSFIFSFCLFVNSHVCFERLRFEKFEADNSYMRNSCVQRDVTPTF